jgi:hypothetical protein
MVETFCTLQWMTKELARLYNGPVDLERGTTPIETASCRWEGFDIAKPVRTLRVPESWFLSSSHEAVREELREIARTWQEEYKATFFVPFLQHGARLFF